MVLQFPLMITRADAEALASHETVVAEQLLTELPPWHQVRQTYEKGILLGKGSFSRVYAGIHLDSGKPVALKQTHVRAAVTTTTAT